MQAAPGFARASLELKKINWNPIAAAQRINLYDCKIFGVLGWVFCLLLATYRLNPPRGLLSENVHTASVLGEDINYEIVYIIHTTNTYIIIKGTQPNSINHKTSAIIHSIIDSQEWCYKLGWSKQLIEINTQPKYH